MKLELHWQVTIAMTLAVAVGWLVQGREAGGSLGWSAAALSETLEERYDGVMLTGVGGPSDSVGLRKGDLVVSWNGEPVTSLEQFLRLDEAVQQDDSVRIRVVRSEPWETVEIERDLRAAMDESSTRAKWLAPFRFVGQIFLRLLQMLIVPLIFSSIVCGVAGVGSSSRVGRLFGKTFFYYLCTSLFAIVTGLVLVSLIRPGNDPDLPLTSVISSLGVSNDEGFLDILIRMIPQNPVASLADGMMLQIIFFALIVGFCIPRLTDPRLRDLLLHFFQAVFDIMMRIAAFVLKLLPYGVFALIVKIIGETGFGVFKPLAWYMLTVACGLLFHCLVTLPLLLRFVGKVSPFQYARAVFPALVTAFSTSSSSVTMPVTLRSVEKRGGVSNRVSSFVLPLGATINMDGTALYECVGVIFLAQFYALTAGFDLTLALQFKVVLMALLASVGAAGIPSAGLVMMLTILTALQLPLEGAALILAVDRPLDMLRTVTNVWSDSCGAAIVARTEGESIEPGTDDGDAETATPGTETRGEAGA